MLLGLSLVINNGLGGSKLRNKISIFIIIAFLISVVTALGSYLLYTDLILLNNTENSLSIKEAQLKKQDEELKVKEESASKDAAELNKKDTELSNKESSLTTKETELNNKEASLKELEEEIKHKENMLGISN